MRSGFLQSLVGDKGPRNREGPVGERRVADLDRLPPSGRQTHVDSGLSSWDSSDVDLHSDDPPSRLIGDALMERWNHRAKGRASTTQFVLVSS